MRLTGVSLSGLERLGAASLNVPGDTLSPCPAAESTAEALSYDHSFVPIVGARRKIHSPLASNRGGLSAHRWPAICTIPRWLGGAVPSANGGLAGLQ